MKRDLVCGMVVDQTTTTHWFDHQDRRYFFRSLHCRDKFAAHPSAYDGLDDPRAFDMCPPHAGGMTPRASAGVAVQAAQEQRVIPAGHVARQKHAAYVAVDPVSNAAPRQKTSQVLIIPLVVDFGFR